MEDWTKEYSRVYALANPGKSATVHHHGRGWYWIQVDEYQTHHRFVQKKTILAYIKALRDRLGET